jgi:hypothetical protein
MIDITLVALFLTALCIIALVIRHVERRATIRRRIGAA